MQRRLSPLAPFPGGRRASGVLLHVTSLPSRYGIGDVGPGAVAFLDRLQEADQAAWQVLPLGPTGYGDSPYQPASSFALNPLLLSPEWLVEDRLIGSCDCAGGSFVANAVDYEAVGRFKRKLIATAWKNFAAGARKDLLEPYEEFCAREARWLDDYALFRALEEAHGFASWQQWPDEIARRAPDAVVRARLALLTRMEPIRFAQFLLFRQLARLSACARDRGVRLIGDLPLFVSLHSADVWAHPDLFLLDGRRRPRVVAGVPPDAFTAEGQLWGNPIYDWDALAALGYGWFVERVRSLLRHVDVIRLDHFRGFAAAWHVPAGAPTAQWGEWKPGPGRALFDALADALGGLPFIAEDLGIITPDVRALRETLRLPGMRVLQFAFDGNPANPHLPENYDADTVVYTGTHDNPTTRGWYQGLSEAGRRDLWRALQSPISSAEASGALVRLAWSSEAGLAIAPLQDLLDLDDRARMNHPGTATGNWRWRATEGMLAGPQFAWLRQLTRATGRANAAPTCAAAS